MTQQDDWYRIKDIDRLDSPALVIFPDRVKKNIRLAITMAGDVNRLRPHIKTNKSPGAVNLMIAAGIGKFKCATIAEAEMLAQCGAKDVLLAYRPLGPKLRRFISLIKAYPGTLFSCIADSDIAAKEMAMAFFPQGLTVPVYIDLNLGMNRTGILPGEEAIRLYAFVAAANGTRAAGLHAYDGHIRDTDLTVRTNRCNEVFAAVERLKTDLEKKGLPVPATIAGGSPTFPIHAKKKDVECSPGTFIYWDQGYIEACPEQGFLPAAVLVTRIVSLPAPYTICTDLGHKSVAAENDITKRIRFLNAADTNPVGHSEEHLVLQTGDAHFYKTGDVLYGIPYHVCPTVALYERVYTIENGTISGEWENTARDRIISL